MESASQPIKDDAINESNEIIEKYKSTILEYLVLMQSSETAASMEDAKYATQMGLSTISNIFKLSFSATKNASTSALICQKGMYCYIEYIEQTQKINGYGAAGSHIDYLDATTFIYDKTLTELYTGSFPGSAKQYGGDKETPVLDHIGRVCDALIWFQNPGFTVLDQMEIVDAHLTGLLETFLEIECKDQILLFLNTVQEVINELGKNEYDEMLGYLIKQLKKRAKHGGIDESAIMQACLYLKTYLPGTTLDKMATLEKWKRPMEDIVKLAF